MVCAVYTLYMYQCVCASYNVDILTHPDKLYTTPQLQTTPSLPRSLFLSLSLYWTQGFYAAMRLVSVCQLGKEPSLAVITLLDPLPRLLGIDSSTIAGFAQKKWTIEVYTCIYMYTMLKELSHARKTARIRRGY